MLPVRIVEEQAWARNRPVRQNLNQSSLPQQFTHAIAFEVISNAKPTKCCSDADVSMIRDDGTVHRNLELLTSFLELPAIMPAVHLQTPVDACMVMQIFRGPRYPSTREIVWRCHGNHVQVRREADSYHVFLDSVTHANPRIEAASHNIRQRIVHHDVENHVRVRLMKARKPRRDDGSRSNPQGVDA